jgi:hypothetical protein
LRRFVSHFDLAYHEKSGIALCGCTLDRTIVALGPFVSVSPTPEYDCRSHPDWRTVREAGNAGNRY